METRLQSNEVRIPKSPQSPVSGCPTFKSTFARSLSFCSNQQNKPLDLEISFRIAQSSNDPANISQSLSTPEFSPPQHGDDDDFDEFMRNSPLKQSIRNLSASNAMPTLTPTRNTASSGISPLSSARKRLQVNLAALCSVRTVSMSFSI